MLSLEGAVFDACIHNRSLVLNSAFLHNNELVFAEECAE